MKVVQWHRDEISQSLKGFVQSNGIRYPAVIVDAGEGDYATIMTSSDLNACAGDPKSMVAELYKQNVLPGKNTGSSSL